MPQREAFLRAILEQPDDDGVRLMYADWLEEQGDPLGEFIRTQVALARWDRPGDPGPLVLREQELLRAHRDEWLGPLSELPARWTFCRGFAEGISTDGPTFLDHALRLFAELPLRAVQLSRVAPQIFRVADLPQLARVTSLDLSGNDLGDPVGHCLAASPYVFGLTTLDLSRNLLGVDGVRRLAGSNFIASLRRLLLGHNPIGDFGAQLLAAGNPRQTWVELDLSFCDLTADGARHLARSAGLASLRSLDLRHNQLGDAGVRALAQSPHLAGLKRLRVGGNGVGALGAKALLETPYLQEIEVLDLGENAVASQQKAALRERFGSRLVMR